jgi:hypothetical protein
MDIGLILFSKNNLTKFARRSFLPLTRADTKRSADESGDHHRMGENNLQPKSSVRLMGCSSWSSNGDSRHRKQIHWLF